MRLLGGFDAHCLIEAGDPFVRRPQAEPFFQVGVIPLDHSDIVPILVGAEAGERFGGALPAQEEVRCQISDQADFVVAVAQDRAVFDSAMLIRFP